MELTKNERDLILAVKHMRDCQKEYFRTRQSEILQESKLAERQVDKMIIDIATKTLFSL